MSQVNKIPLAKRLERLREGHAGDPAYITSAIYTLANIPIREYLRAYPDDFHNLKQLLGVTEDELERMVFRDVAKDTYKVGCRPGTKWRMIGAMEVLAKPLADYYAKRRVVK